MLHVQCVQNCKFYFTYLYNVHCSDKNAIEKVSDCPGWVFINEQKVMNAFRYHKEIFLKNLNNIRQNEYAKS